MKIQTKSGFSGVYPMLYAIFDERGRLHRETIRRQVSAMLRANVHGLAVLGLASEGNKLSPDERRTFMEWVAEDCNGARPLAVTAAEPNIQAQIDFVRAAASCRASWVILQPPPVRGIGEAELLRFFAAIAEKSDLPIGIQNAPEFLGIGLSSSTLKTLVKQHPNVVIVKMESAALGVSRLIEDLDGTIDVFSGRAGIDLVDCLRAGAVGVIPGAEAADILVEIFNLLKSGDPGDREQAEALYRDVLPLLLFLMDSIDSFLVYGKRLFALRMGIEQAGVRQPSYPTTAFGLESLMRHTRRIPPLQ
jgi:2-keto-3-deoxy-L-arabinonate dehydratase